MGSPTLRPQGCDLNPNCFQCDLPDCRYNGIAGNPRQDERNAAIRRLRAQGVSTKALAERFGLSKSTIRMIAPQKKGAPVGREMEGETAARN